MAISFDTANKSTAATGSATASSLSWTHTVAAGGSDDELTIAFGISNSNTISGINWDDGGANQTALVQVGTIVNGIVGRADVWRLSAPIAKTATIKATFSGLSHAAAVAVVAHSVRQTTPFDASQNATGNTQDATKTVTTGGVGDIIVASVVKRDSTENFTVDSGTTEIAQAISGSATPASNVRCALCTAVGAASVAIGENWTASATNRNWAILAAPLNPSSPFLDGVIFTGGMADLVGGMTG